DAKVKFSRVDADLSGLTQKGEDVPKLDADRLQTLFRDALDQKELSVSLEGFKDADLPAMVVEEEQMRRFRDMSRLYGNSGFAMPASFKLVLNPRNPVIAALNARPADAETFELCRQIYDLAEMARQPLEPEAMSKFISRSNALLSWLVRSQN
nr:hypothetical protein [Clostridia bacterium]